MEGLTLTALFFLWTMSTRTMRDDVIYRARTVDPTQTLDELVNDELVRYIINRSTPDTAPLWYNGKIGNQIEFNVSGKHRHGRVSGSMKVETEDKTAKEYLLVEVLQRPWNARLGVVYHRNRFDREEVVLVGETSGELKVPLRNLRYKESEGTFNSKTLHIEKLTVYALSSLK